MELPTAVKRELQGAFSLYAGRVRQLSSSLSDEQFWHNPYPYGNSFGNLVLHLTGNLNEYVGRQIAGTDYVRDREREFAEADKFPKEDVLAAFDQAVEMVLSVLEIQTAESLSGKPHDSDGEHFSNRSRFGVFLHCVSHLNHHVGQMIYLEKELQQKPHRHAS